MSFKDKLKNFALRIFDTVLVSVVGFGFIYHFFNNVLN